MPSLSPPYPAFSLLYCPPSPRPALAERSSPVGKGEILGYFMQGASPLASPGLNPGGTGAGAAYRALAGGLPRRCRMTLPSRNSQGRLAFFVARLNLPLVSFFSPIPPTPFPGGEGGIQGYFMQGASPLASPGLSPGGTGTGAAYHAPAGGLPQRCRLTLPSRNSQGRLAFFVASLPCL